MSTKANRSVRIAAGLLKISSMSDADVLEYIGFMEPAEKAALRGQVEWVLAYESAEGGRA